MTCYQTVKKFVDRCNRFDRIPACDGQTDGQTDKRMDTLRRHSPRYAYASRGKNAWQYASSAIKMRNISTY